METLLLVWAIALLAIVIALHRKEMKKTQTLKELINIYDRSEKVIKNCVVYTSLPINLTGHNFAFVSCCFENLEWTTPTAELIKILGINKQDNGESIV